MALSRVREGDNIRLLLTGDAEHQRWLSLAHSLELKPDPSIQYFFDGFRPYDQQNPNQNWVTNKWDANRANQQYKLRMEEKQGRAKRMSANNRKRKR